MFKVILGLLGLASGVVAVETCENDVWWRRANVEGRVEANRDCEWVGGAPSTRCSSRGTSDAVATEACPLYCDAACADPAPKPSVAAAAIESDSARRPMSTPTPSTPSLVWGRRLAAECVVVDGWKYTQGKKRWTCETLPKKHCGKKCKTCGKDKKYTGRQVCPKCGKCEEAPVECVDSWSYEEATARACGAGGDKEAWEKKHGTCAKAKKKKNGKLKSFCKKAVGKGATKYDGYAVCVECKACKDLYACASEAKKAKWEVENGKCSIATKKRTPKALRVFCNRKAGKGKNKYSGYDVCEECGACFPVRTRDCSWVDEASEERCGTEGLAGDAVAVARDACPSCGECYAPSPSPVLHGSACEGHGDCGPESNCFARLDGGDTIVSPCDKYANGGACVEDTCTGDYRLRRITPRWTNVESRAAVREAPVDGAST